VQSGNKHKTIHYIVNIATKSHVTLILTNTSLAILQTKRL